MMDAVMRVLDDIIDGIVDAAVTAIALSLYVVVGVIEMAVALLTPIWIVPYLIIKRRRDSDGESKNL